MARILVVDDEASVRSSARKPLERGGRGVEFYDRLVVEVPHPRRHLVVDAVRLALSRWD